LGGRRIFAAARWDPKVLAFDQSRPDACSPMFNSARQTTWRTKKGVECLVILSCRDAEVENLLQYELLSLREFRRPTLKKNEVSVLRVFLVKQSKGFAWIDCEWFILNDFCNFV
jgi:hypothetical protein